VSFKEKQRKEKLTGILFSSYLHICRASYITNHPGRKTIQNKNMHLVQQLKRGSSPSKSFPERDLSSVHKNTNY